MNKWNWLKEYLQKNNISQAEVAEALQWQKTRVSELLCGKRDLPVNKVYLASQFFNLDLEELTKYNSGFTKTIPSTNTKKTLIKRDTNLINIDILDTSDSKGKNLDISPIGKQSISAEVLKRITNVDPKNIKILLTHGDAMQPTINDGDAVWIDMSIKKPTTDGLYLFSIKGELFVKRLFFDDFNKNISIISDNNLYPPIIISNMEKVSTLGKVISILKIIK